MKKTFFIFTLMLIFTSLIVGTAAANTLDEIIEDENMVLIDSRSPYSYNGWEIDGEPGGHIPGAVLFSKGWLNHLESDTEIISELERFNINEDQELFVYGPEADGLAEELSSLGYMAETISVDLEEQDELQKLDHYELLVHPDWLNEKIENDEVYVLEASWGDDSAHIEGHIPTSVHMNTDAIEEGPLWNRRSDDEIINALGEHGITYDMTVVVYSLDDITPATRVASILMYAGVEDVRILDGNLPAWENAGYDLDSGEVEPDQVDFGYTEPANPDYIIDLPEAQEAYDDSQSSFVDIRSWEEFIGETSGYDYIPSAGRIEGAIYGYGGKDAYDMSDFRNPDDTMVNFNYMEARWLDQGINPDNYNIFYCGTGWRAAETWLYAKALGWQNITVFDGGWFEWSEEELPVTVGE